MRMLSGSSEGQIVDRQRPLIATVAEISGAHIVSPHYHPRGQLLYALNGAMQASVESRAWSLTPRTAVWVPPGSAHHISARNDLSYRFVFVDPDAARRLPQHATALEVTPLARELILQAAAFGTHYRPGSPESRLVGVLHDQLRTLPVAQMALPLPHDSRARRVCEALLDNPADDRSLREWGNRVGASSRTLARLFLSETGLTFGNWGQRMRLSMAIDRLAQGDTLTRIALDLGYASPSAFSTMFRRVLGRSPRCYFS